LPPGLRQLREDETVNRVDSAASRWRRRRLNGLERPQLQPLSLKDLHDRISFIVPGIANAFWLSGAY
jgi:hypothetical protein